MDRIIGYDYWMVLGHLGYWIFHPSLGDVVAVASQGRFFVFLHPSLGDVVADASQGRFSFWSKKVISGPDFLKNGDIWSDFIKLDQIGSTLVSLLVAYLWLVIFAYVYKHTACPGW